MRLRYFRNRGDQNFGEILGNEALRIGGSGLKEEIPWFSL